MRFPLARFTQFATALRIPSKEAGPIPLTFLGTQRYLLRQIARGLAEGVHDFVILKGRQLGYSTVTLALILWWHLHYKVMQGMVVNDSDDNHDYFRDVLREMLASLPDDYRVPVLIDNDTILRWQIIENARGRHVGGSRIGYAVAGATKRKQGKLARGRGLNVLLGDELDYWLYTKDIQALESSLAEAHPHRLFLRGSTANGYGVLYDLWNEAEHAVTKRRIFVGSWMNEKYRVERGTALWRAYGDRTLSAHERAAVVEVKRQFGMTISAEHLAWRRYQLVEKFKGDEAMLLQEHGMVPDDCFQAAGLQFISAPTIQRLRRTLADSPPPRGYVYRWGQRLDTSPDPESVEELSDATLVIYEEPDPQGAYLIGAVPMGSHQANSIEHAITVWRIYPDWVVQVAEYCSTDDVTYQFAWALLHLCGAYHQYVPPFLALEIQGTGRRVYEEINRFMENGFGLSESLRASDAGVRDLLGNVRHYLYRRADSLTRRAVRQWQGTNTLSTVLMHELRDEVERGYLAIRSPRLVTELADRKSVV